MFLKNPYWTSDERQKLQQLYQKVCRPQHIYLASSGSSQALHESPKLIEISEEALQCASQEMNLFLGASPRDHWIRPLPAWHIGGHAIEVRANLSHSSWSDFFPWNPEAFVEEVRQKRASFSSIVPAQLHDLVSYSLRAPESLRKILVGGARLPDELFSRALALGWPIIKSYGMTESSAALAVSQGPGPFLQILPHMQVRVSSQGLLELRSPALFSSWSQVRGDREIHQSHPKGQWWTTSDLGEVQGRQLQVWGRGSEFAKILGENISLRLILEKLNQHFPAVISSEAAVILTRPHPRRGEALDLIVEVPNKTSRAALSLESLNAKLSGLEQIDALYFLPKFPRTDLGKIKIEEVRMLISQGFS